MKISVKLELYKFKTYVDGSHPIILSYIINGKRKKVTIDKAQLEDWDFKTNRIKTKAKNSALKNNHISSRLNQAETEVYNIRMGNGSVSDILKERTSLTFNQALQKEFERLKKEMKSGVHTRLEVLKGQLVELDINVDDIDSYWLKKQIEQFNKLGNAGSTIQKKVKTLRGLIDRYATDGASSDIKSVKIKATKAIKVKLTAEEVEKIENLPLNDNYQIKAARDLFLLQIYLRGARIGDLLQARSEDFTEGRFTYITDKVGLPISLKLIPKAIEIVEQYKNKYERLFPFFKWSADPKLSDFENKKIRLKHKESCTTIVNRHLKIVAHLCGINKPLSSHIARHTFARMAIDKIANPMITMDLLGHSSLAVHQSYLNDIRKDDQLDAATDDIFS